LPSLTPKGTAIICNTMVIISIKNEIFVTISTVTHSPAILEKKGAGF
jgi:hypothetical protein